MKTSNRWAALPLLLIAILAMAVSAAPAIASGSYKLEQEGKPIPTGKILELTNVGNLFYETSRFPTISCQNGSLRIQTKVIEDSSSRFLTEPGGEAHTGYCTSPGGTVVVQKNLVMEKMMGSGGGSGIWDWLLRWEAPSTYCAFEGNNDAFTYTPGSSQIKFERRPLTLLTGGCGQVNYSGTFAVSYNGKPVTIN